MTSLAVRVLGDFTVDGLDRRALGSRKARQLLHLLALARGRAVPAGVLIEALWPDTSPSRPEDQLSVLVSRLRATLGRDRIEHRDGGYLLHCDWLDAAELTALADEVDRRRDAGNIMGAAAAARVVLSLTRGAEQAQAPGEWARLRQGELERLVSRSRCAAAVALLEAGDWSAAVEAAAVTLQHDPYDEAALRVLLRGYAAGGQVAAALAAYAAARQRLADELGCDPAPATAALHVAILRGELPAAGTTAAGTTAAAARIVGRDDELSYLDAIAVRARAGRTEVAILDGEAGIGKTTVLRGWCASREQAGDCVLLASCGPLDRAMPLDALLIALRGLLRRLGPAASADLIGVDATLLDPLLGDAPGQVVPLADSMLGPAVLYAALSRVFRRLIQRAPLVVAVDDAHLAGQALRDLLRFIVREQLPAMILAAVRTGEGEPMAGTARVHLDALSRQAVAELAGAEQADELYARSLGHPLFLTELIHQAPGAELPASLVESVSARCGGLDTAGALLRTAAVIGPELDVDLLAALLGRGAVDVLDDAERAIAARLLVADQGVIRFRHELVREALAATATADRVGVLHRQAGRVLAARGDADPASVAQHARLGGDQALASAALGEAAARAAERFDHAAAEALLDDALALRPAPGIWLDRARVRTRRARYGDALRDVERAAAAAGAGPAALEVGAWAAYFDRRFTDAAHFADDGALAAGDERTRARCLAAGGRIRHAAGDLPGAERQLTEALSVAEGPDRVTAAAWLGVLRAHQSRAAEAFALLRPASRGQIGVEHTSATLHALLFLGHAHAVAGYPALALDAFAQHTAEVRRRQVPRFAGRAVNYAGWVLRNLGAAAEARDHHVEALETGRGQGTAEVMIAALEDLAEHCVDGGDVDGARSYLRQAGQLLAGDLVFGWRLRLKLDLVTGRLALLRDDGELAMTYAVDLEARAGALGVPRYVSVARLLRHRARHRLGLAVDLAEVAADLDLLDASMALEAWWWTGDLAADYANQGLLSRAADRAARLARHAGRYADTLNAAVRRRMDAWEKAR